MLQLLPVLNNLNCPHCSAKIEETVKKQAEFENVIFNFVNKKMTMDSQLSEEETLSKVKGIVDSIEEGVDTVLSRTEPDPRRERARRSQSG